MHGRKPDSFDRDIVTEEAACHPRPLENAVRSLDPKQMSASKNGNLHARPGEPPAYSDESLTVFSLAMTKLYTLWARATYPFAATGHNLWLHHASEISRRFAPRIRLGNRVEIARHVWLALGLEGPHELKIIIEDGCRIAAGCTITAKNSIYLERDVVLAPHVLLMDHAHAYEDVSRPIKIQGPTPGGRIRIGEGCRIGRRAAILCDKGELVLGRNCIVAARAVVGRSFPPNSVISGNPARVVPQSSTTKVAAEQESARRSAAEFAKQDR